MVESPDFITLHGFGDFVPVGTEKGTIETLENPSDDVSEFFEESLRQCNFLALRNENLATHLAMRKGR